MSVVVCGPHVKVFINGTLFGEATSLRVDSATPHKDISGVDSLMPYEIAPTAARISGSIGVVRRHGTGGLEGRGIVAPFRHLPKERYFALLVIDRFTGEKLVQCDHCKCTGQNWQFMAKQVASGSFNFQGIDWGNESPYP